MLALFAAQSACAGDDGGHDVARAGSGAPDSGTVDAFTVAVLPDTQFYACAYPDIFERQTQWIVEQHAARGIGLVLHTGDIVDKNVQAQWDVAASSLHLLDGVVPYMLATGNHDVGGGRESLIDDYFVRPDGAAGAHAPSPHDPDRFDNTFVIVQLAGRPWLFIGLEFGPRDEVVEWAGSVLAANADVPAVLFTHAYLYSDGARYDRAVQPQQNYHPDQYAFTPELGINDGEDLWRKLIEPHENVRLVLSGHVIPDGIARSVATRASGSRVHQLLANYQLCALCPCTESEGGGGYLRMLEFDAAAERIAVTTYSPHHDAALDDDENAFTLDL
jgi:3',5'-cyclic AMP phosphodiesterase CpdA